jgi:hypothetical protein
MKTADNESRFLTSYNLPSSVERIKPPPSCIDSGKKKIKLGSGSISTKGDSSDKKTITIKSTIKLKEIAVSLDEVHKEQTNPGKKMIKLNHKRPKGCKTSEMTGDSVVEQKFEPGEQESMVSIEKEIQK